MHKHSINDQISVKRCFVINEEKENVGERDIVEALELARQANLDLVLVSENPDVCKIMDYQKVIYDQKKKLKLQKKNSKERVTREKEIRLGVYIAKHDLDIKIKRAKEFLGDGNRVKLSCRMHRRQANQIGHVLAMFKKFYEESRNTEMPLDFIKVSETLISGVIMP